MKEIPGPPLSPPELATLAAYDASATAWAELDDGGHRYDFAQFVGLIKGPKILDIGCGTGEQAPMMLEHGLDYTGIDISEGMLTVARRRLPRETFLRMSMHQLDFPSDEFDAVWIPNSIYHVPKERTGGVLDQVQRVMKDGAVTFIVVPLGKGEVMMPFLYEDLELQVSHWGRKEFGDLLLAHGFQLVGFMVEDNHIFYTARADKTQKVETISEELVAADSSS